ncbi:hypothetical protein [Conexibacter sp. SYSU D00693]|uniref:hypothetical protein n=1 Tax=Conexibacter sp. SYSU D00693 TaxID=2812560 RepID=UPI00196A613B|nr:hypothetical protein [Conexibacter sp. SYSU D00693]
MAQDVEVLVAVAHGLAGHVAAVVRDPEGGVLLTSSSSHGAGALLDDDHDLALEGYDDHVVVGGLLPDGAVAADVDDEAGAVHAAACDRGAWVCVLPASRRVRPPRVVFRDPSGAVVPRRRRQL